MGSVSDALAPHIVGVDHHTLYLRIAPSMEGSPAAIGLASVLSMFFLLLPALLLAVLMETTSTLSPVILELDGEALRSFPPFLLPDDFDLKPRECLGSPRAPLFLLPSVALLVLVWIFPAAPLEVSLGLHYIEISRNRRAYKLLFSEITAVGVNAKYLSLTLAGGRRVAVSLPPGLDPKVLRALLALLMESIARDQQQGRVPAEIERIRAHSSR